MMRWLLLSLVALWSVLTVVAYTVILPESRESEPVIAAYFAIAEDPQHPAATATIEAFRAHASTLTDLPELAEGRLSSVLAMAPADRARWFDAFRAWDAAQSAPVLRAYPTLTWSTDDNPARRTQCDLFRQWHLRTYGEPADVVTDPSNRDITKTVVQCVAGAGPDIIEVFGPAELGQLIEAGVAMDITDAANAEGFGLDTVFPAVVPSISRNGRQHAYPCNVGYTVLFYHRDMFEQSGVAEPTASWTLDDLINASKRIVGNPAVPSNPRFGFMNYGAWDAALAAGGRWFNEDGTAPAYDSPQTVAGFRAYRDLMYVHGVMPTPAQAASMAASGGSNMNAGAEAASASALFASKGIAMTIGGRWEYVALARRNLDRVIRPAAERRIASLPTEDPERTLLTTALDSLTRDVLVPISDAQFAAIEASLTEADRAQLVQLGVAHVPTVTGTPFYSVAARSAVANRASPRADAAARFLRFLSSREYNEQINATFDSICGVPAFCLGENGVSGPPAPLPGLEAFDSPVFAEAVFHHAHPWQLSPFIGHARLGAIAGQVMERLTADQITPEAAAAEIDGWIDQQMRANITRDAGLRAEWERRTGVTFDPAIPLRDQVKRSTPAPAAGGAP
jgi:ABC-type glycerol-3-phosphate transport system substrate-binding protein